jgi:Dolichyl-phosphate-mannose-protein mannosyltransferase
MIRRMCRRFARACTSMSRGRRGRTIACGGTRVASGSVPQRSYSAQLLVLLWAQRRLLLLAAIPVAYLLYAANIHVNPPGFFMDESAIAWNAFRIGQDGRDEHGDRWPIYFRSWGDYKSPIYIYVLAALFKLTGPSIIAARLLSVTAGFVTALLLGVLARRLSDSGAVGALTGFTALATPWLFEINRLVFEVAILPLALVLFLLALERAHRRTMWRASDIIAIAAALGIVTYSYTTCRLLGPLLALGLLSFAGRGRFASVLWTWFAYIVTLVPMLLFAAQNPHALLNRFHTVTYIRATTTTSELIVQFAQHYIANLSPAGLLWRGDPNTRHHVVGMGSLLVAPTVLAAIGIVLISRARWRHPWWRFVSYGLAVSVVPASLTVDDIHTLRLAPFPIFLVLLMVPALVWLIGMARRGATWRNAAGVLLGLLVAQAVLFQLVYHRRGPYRTAVFDAAFPAFLRAVTEWSDTAIYFADTAYVHAYWYGLLQHAEMTRFIRLRDGRAAPEGALVVVYSGNARGCNIVLRRENFVACRDGGRGQAL